MAQVRQRGEKKPLFTSRILVRAMEGFRETGEDLQGCTRPDDPKSVMSAASRNRIRGSKPGCDQPQDVAQMSIGDTDEMSGTRQCIVGVVDDDAGVRESLKFLLETCGFGVVTFSSAEELLNAPGKDMIDCLLVDQNMPNCTGLELLAKLQPRIPTALITAWPTVEVAERAVQLNVAHVLEKPIDDVLLLEFVAQPQQSHGSLPKLSLGNRSPNGARPSSSCPG